MGDRDELRLGLGVLDDVRDLEPGRRLVQGRRQRLDSLQSTTGHPCGAVLDGNYLYYANYEANTIVRFDVTASPLAPVTIAQAPTIQRPNTLVADGTSIYVTNEGTATVSGTSPGIGREDRHRRRVHEGVHRGHARRHDAGERARSPARARGR